MPRNPRDYQKEAKYDKSPKRMADNAARKRARRAMEKKVGKAALKGKDVSHRDGNPRNNSAKNLGVSSRKANRSYPRTKTARKKNPRD